MNSQFQLSLELTNLLNPITSTISTLGSIALVKAIRDAGSDALTELELASWLGRNRIDPVILIHFRQAVGKSEQTKLAEYLDIVLHSGAGPTVQNALKNPELLSMVIQLSFLCSIFETDSLANGLVEVMTENIKDSGGHSGNVPNYTALCGTLRVCKQETVDFQWETLFTAIETRIKRDLRPILYQINHNGILDRTIPFPVFRVLLLSLHSLQHFPDERCLHIQCNEGITTIIVWCYYVLGLNVLLNYNHINFVFGPGSPSVFIRQNHAEPCYATLLHPANENDPLFSLTPENGQPELQLEPRGRTRGFGMEQVDKLQDSRNQDFRHQDHDALWVIRRALQVSKAQTSKSDLSLPGKGREYHLPDLDAEIPEITENMIIHAAKLLFNLESVDEIVFNEDFCCQPGPRERKETLTVLLLSLARVQTEDLKTCGDLPLLNGASTLAWIQDSRNPSIEGLKDGDLQCVVPRLSDAFNILSAFLAGPSSSEARDRDSVLISSCGWSLFFGAICALDPWEARTSALRIVRGVPVRGGIRRERIYDGPTEPTVAPSIQRSNTEDPGVSLVEGSRQIVRSRYLSGYRGSDAFEITQIFECHDSKAKGPRFYRLGFRQMVELSARYSLIPPCHCNGDFPSLQGVVKNFVRDVVEINNVDAEVEAFQNFECYEDGRRYRLSIDGALFEHLSHHQNCDTCVFYRRAVFSREGRILTSLISSFLYVAENPAARWVQLWKIISSMPGEDDSSRTRSSFFLRGRKTCLQCAVEAIVPRLGVWSPYVSLHDNINISCVLL